MAKPNSKKSKRTVGKKRSSSKTSRFKKRFLGSRPMLAFKKARLKVSQARARRYRPHKTFRRSYREDYHRQTKVPGILEHIVLTFRMIFSHWKTFLPFILLMMAGYILLVGLMSEDFYRQFQDSIEITEAEQASGEIGNFAKAGLLLISTVTTGGLNSSIDEVGTVFMVILFLIMWLVTIFLVRHFLVGKHPKLRDGLYNALGPLLSTFVVFAAIFIQAIPMMLVLITYSAAVATGFLSTPFYALIYFLFAALMLLISLYCFSSSLIALAAVTAPGLYPMRALGTASDLMMGRRIHFIIRLFALLITIVIIYVIIMMPVILLDLVLKNAWSFLESWPIVPFMLLFTTCFVFIYFTTYIYQYYRWLLDYQEK